MNFGTAGGFDATFPKYYTSESAMSPIRGPGGSAVEGDAWQDFMGQGTGNR